MSAATGQVPTAAAQRAPLLYGPTVAAMLFNVALCIAAIAWTLRHWNPLTVAAAMLLLSTRQHALFILFHDAVHFHVSSNKRLNDLLTNLFIGTPQLVPVQLYRRLHLAHHARLGTADDPERLLLYRDQPWDYRPLPLRLLLRQLCGDLLLLNNLRTLRHFARELRTMALPESRSWPEFYLLEAAFLCALGAWWTLAPAMFWRFALLWFVPLLTLTQAIQKVRSFAEHAAMDAPELSYSWRPGLFGRLTLWPFHINYHREHHIHPRIPWYRLPAAFPDVRQRPGSELLGHLWNGRW